MSAAPLVPTCAALANILIGADHVPQYVIDKTMRVAQAHRASIRMYYEAGGKIAMGTDAPLTPHGDNLRELGRLVEVGMTPARAPRCSSGCAVLRASCATVLSPVPMANSTALMKVRTRLSRDRLISARRALRRIRFLAD